MMTNNLIKRYNSQNHFFEFRGSKSGHPHKTGYRYTYPSHNFLYITYMWENKIHCIIVIKFHLNFMYSFARNHNITNYLVVIGGLDLSQGYEPGRVVLKITRSNIKLHESYNPVTYKNDIALIRLPRPVLPSGKY